MATEETWKEKKRKGMKMQAHSGQEDKAKVKWVKVVDAHIKVHRNGKWSDIKKITGKWSVSREDEKRKEKLLKS